MDPQSPNIMGAAMHPVLWIAAIAVFAIIGIQTVIYFRAARVAAPAAGMSRQEVNKAYRAGVISSIGPSLAVCLIAVTLIGVLGTPGVLVRIGLIGSAPYELTSAGVVASSVGAELGGEGWTQQVFAAALLAMGIGGAGWMIVTLIVTPILKRGQNRVEASSKRGAATMAIVTTAAMFGAFGAFGIQQLAAGVVPALVALSSAVVMILAMLLARSPRFAWLKEWALGIALVIGIGVAILLTQTGIGA
ncbi:DUF5058 family protein [Microbacterium indicum]|uniref:DUF5058 family protein n=1 Tax=Microbacterium indicum TaxID=358100 RepID=UPI000406C0CD|nr:DUF5058 family protein [Microbacterium indicum]